MITVGSEETRLPGKACKFFSRNPAQVSDLNPIRPDIFSRSSVPGGGGLRGPNAKSQDYDQPIKMKLCMSQYSHESMPAAKFKSSSFSSFGDMTSQNFPLKRGISHKIRTFTPGK